MGIKQRIGSVLRKLLPKKIYRLVANGAIVVPAYYKQILIEAEHNQDFTLEDTDDRELLLMRKYAHIVDKGLHRSDAEPGHSRAYYNLLKHAVERLENSQYSDDATLEWAKQRLQNYEDLQDGSDTAPLCGEKPEVTVTYDQISDLIKARRTNRDFSDKAVTDDTISRLKELANWASSSCNKQPIEIYATNDADLAAECLKCCKGGTGFSKHIPSFWVFTANVRGYVWPSEMFLPYVDVSLGAQNVFLAETTLGLSSCILSWAQKDDEEERKLRDLLSIPAHHQIIFCAVTGYAKTQFQTPARKLDS